jgi:hypothetical protein
LKFDGFGNHRLIQTLSEVKVLRELIQFLENRFPTKLVVGEKGHFCEILSLD